MSRLERRIRACLDKRSPGHGMTAAECMALGELRLRGAPSSADLARTAFITPQAMNLVIRDLEQRGLIRRDPHPRGGRSLLKIHIVVARGFPKAGPRPVASKRTSSPGAIRWPMNERMPAVPAAHPGAREQEE